MRFENADIPGSRTADGAGFEARDTAAKTVLAGAATTA
jgi:hypothetical protein